MDNAPLGQTQPWVMRTSAVATAARPLAVRMTFSGTLPPSDGAGSHSHLPVIEAPRHVGYDPAKDCSRSAVYYIKYPLTVNIAPHELHAIAALCANPDNPDSRDYLAGLRPLVRAVAIAILRRLSPGTYAVPALVAEGSVEAREEVDEAADEFHLFLAGRKSEQDLCTQGLKALRPLSG